MSLPRRRFLDRTLWDLICVVSIVILFVVVYSATAALVLAFSLLLFSLPVDVVLLRDSLCQNWTQSFSSIKTRYNTMRMQY